MNPNYKNWVPNGMIAALSAGTALLGAGTAALLCTKMNTTAKKLLAGTTGLGAAFCGGMLGWSVYAHGKFSYNGQRQLSKQIVEGTAEYITLPEGGVGLDVGCGSGALTIACAKRNPQGRMVGIDRWGAEYASFSKKLCEKNAAAEGADNTEFHQGDACKLNFDDETFDAVTSNYVYHNIAGVNKQQLLRETLRVLKKGGTFAIHDIMTKARYGDMMQFINELYDEGYERVQLIDTTTGKFMTRKEAALLMLGGSALLIGKK
jgi:ubiquinone/menaquinone biosynthesis C-methylase UbiE